MIINPYKNGSRGAKEIKLLLRQRKIGCWTLQKPPTNPNTLIVNWGNSEFGYPVGNLTIVNPPHSTGLMTNKVKFFATTKGSTDVLESTHSRSEALGWKSIVFARTLIEASGGRGIIVFDPETDDASTLPNAPLYTRYVPKTHEYRLHLARGLRDKQFTVMLAQRKVFCKTSERPAPLDWKVRSHDNGFIFQRQPDFERIPASVMGAAARVMTEHFPGLHFAALDVMYHEKKNTAWVIEGNTAPGLENSSIAIYADYFQALEKEHRQCLLRN